MAEQPNFGEQEPLSQQPPVVGQSAGAIDNNGIVYVLSNPAMQGYIKIGKTSGDSPADVQRRMKELDSTNMSRAFDCEYAAEVQNYGNVGAALHTAFGEFRVRENREFFEGLMPFRVKAVLKLLEISDVTPEGPAAIDTEDIEREKPPRRPNFTF